MFFDDEYKNNYFVYIMSNKYKGTLYVGSTNNLARRIYTHRNGLVKKAFTNRYKLTKLVYYELAGDMPGARHREWLIKRWKRSWKERLIESINPNWNDLYNEIL